jgi:hypothetical protein
MWGEVSAGPAIPKGWRKLRKGVTIKDGDKILDAWSGKWNATLAAGHKAGDILTPGPYIRRIKPRGGKKGEK